MEMPLVSIIVPVYNAQSHLSRCLESICGQEYKDLELIVINDGSKDKSLPVCEEFRKKDSRILLVDKANSGVSDTRNLGLKLAGGKYVQFVDSDDYIAPDYTARLVEAAEKTGADLVISPYTMVIPAGASKPEQVLEKIQDDLGVMHVARPPENREYGFLPERNVVTVAAVEGYSGIMGIGYSRPEYLDLIAAWLRGHDRPYRRSIILLVAQDTAQMLAREGWTREAMRQYIRERARIPFGEWNRQYHGAKEARKGVPEEVFAIADPNELVDKPFFDSMPVIVAGGTGEKSMLLPCWASGKMVSQEIRLPASWGEGVR